LLAHDPVALGYVSRLVISAKRAGFVVIRIKGSPHYLRHRDDPERRTVIALHPGDLPPGTLHSILKQSQTLHRRVAQTAVASDLLIFPLTNPGRR
jgi:predicted RNA binding protein YcfA (HicA-like mRNA interferase family)